MPGLAVVFVRRADHVGHVDVVVGFDASGNSSTVRPLASLYSVMPSMVGPWVMPGGTAACAPAPTKSVTSHAAMRRESENVEDMESPVRVRVRSLHQG